jgi:hypothetical protein
MNNRKQVQEDKCSQIKRQWRRIMKLEDSLQYHLEIQNENEDYYKESILDLEKYRKQMAFLQMEVFNEQKRIQTVEQRKELIYFRSSFHDT